MNLSQRWSEGGGGRREEGGGRRELGDWHVSVVHLSTLKPSFYEAGAALAGSSSQPSFSHRKRCCVIAVISLPSSLSLSLPPPPLSL